MPVVFGIVLAAGSSRRMGAKNKLLHEWQGKPMIRHVFDAARESRLDGVLVVTGHQQQAIHAALPEATTCHNPRHEEGMGTSVACGISHLPACDAALIMLGDMPLLKSADINALIDVFDGDPDAVIAAAHEGKRGNPVLFGRNHFEALGSLKGDEGARQIIAQCANVVSVEIGAAGRHDFDTPEALRQLP